MRMHLQPGVTHVAIRHGSKPLCWVTTGASTTPRGSALALGKQLFSSTVICQVMESREGHGERWGRVGGRCAGLGGRTGEALLLWIHSLRAGAEMSSHVEGLLYLHRGKGPKPLSPKEV